MEILSTLNGLRAILGNLIFNPGFPRCAQSVQLVAATLTAACLGDNPVRAASPPLRAVRFVSTTLAAAGESMTIDVQYRDSGSAFTSILDAPFVYDHTKTAPVYDVGVSAAFLAPPGLGGVPSAGGTFRVVRTYVPGGGPTMTSNGVFVDYYGDASP